METKPIITPTEYKRIKARYDEALLRRAEQIRLDCQKMTKTAVAVRWDVDAAIITRVTKTYQPE